MSKRAQGLLPSMITTLVLSPAFANDVVVQLGAGDGFVIQDSTATERWRIDEDGNLTRSGALFLHEANGNVSLGSFAGSANTTGSNNSAFGRSALVSNTTGAQNSAFGAFRSSGVTWANRLLTKSKIGAFSQVTPKRVGRDIEQLRASGRPLRPPRKPLSATY